jgi:nucleotide-binding universal stress UspA family protein
MYRHILVPIDCTDDARRAVMQIIHYFANEHIVKVTLAASVTPTDDSKLRDKRIAHAEEALKAAGNILARYGVYTRRIVVEGEDHAAALAEYAADELCVFDVVVLGAYQARTEEFDMPCRGSLADRLSQLSPIPVMILPR